MKRSIIGIVLFFPAFLLFLKSSSAEVLDSLKVLYQEASSPKAKLFLQLQLYGEYKRLGNKEKSKIALLKADSLSQLTEVSLNAVKEYKKLALNTKRNDIEKSYRLFETILFLSKRYGYPEQEAKVLVQLADYHSLFGSHKFALKQLDRALAIADSLNLQEGKATIYLYRGEIQMALNDYSKSFDNFARSFTLAERNGDIKIATRAKRGMGQINYFTDNYYTALSFFQEALIMILPQNDYELIASMYNNLGNAFDELNQKDSAYTYYSKAEKLYKEINNQRNLAGVWVNKGLVLSSKGNQDSAIIYYRKSMNMYQEIGFTRYIPTVLLNMGESYKILDENEQALVLFYQARDAYEEADDQDGLSIIFNNIAEIFLAQDKLEEAEQYAIDAYTISNKFGMKGNLKKSSLLLSRIYEQKGDYESALLYLKRSNDFQELLDDEMKEYDKSTIEIKIKQETYSLKEEQEKLNAKIQQLQAKIDSQQQTQTIGGLISLLVILILAFLVAKSRVKIRKT